MQLALLPAQVRNVVHLVVVQVQQSQVLQLGEGTSGDLANAVPVQTKLLQTCWEA